MGLQTRDLWMVALGTEGDHPPDELQPPLPDGMHLRWAFDAAKGFPWHGYYLFRRPAERERRPRCLDLELRRQRPGPWPSPQLPLGFGELVSDRPLVFTDDFPPAGAIEVDLDVRGYVAWRLPPGEPARWAEVTIGLRGDETGGRRDCVDFRREQPGVLPNPLSRDGVTFLASDDAGVPLADGGLLSLDGAVGWHTGHRAEIQLPCPATRVDVTLAHGARPPEAIAFDGEGNAVDSGAMTGNGPETITLRGEAITAVHVNAGQDEAILLTLCWVCGDDTGDGDNERTIRVLARFGGLAVAATEVSGAPDDVRAVVLEADAFDEIVIGPGAAVLIDVCIIGVRQGLGEGWEPIPGFDYPLCLPVEHPDYPCPGKPATPADAEATGIGRVSYGPPAPWAGARFQALHDRLERLVAGGPAVAMADRHEPVAGTPAPPPEVGGTITHQQQRPLDLLQVGSLNPAIAQILGLYWLDDTAPPGVAQDYIILADHDGSLGGSADSALTWLATVADFTVVDGFACFNKVVGLAAPVPPPAGARAYALPGATVAPAAGGEVIDATNNAGLTWDRKEIGDVLEPDAPVLYHVWRADLGNVVSPPEPGDDDFAPLTESSPLPVGRSILSPPQVPERAADWPPFGLHYLDRGLIEGWYAYRVSGVDIFGRHSAAGSSAEWRQWAPAPDPRPWYYVDPPGDRVIDATKIRLLDKLAPPPPTGVEAFALDPDDPTVLHDADWQTWRDSLSPAEKTGVIGLRARWRWTPAHQRQAPDAREFRIYYQPAPVNTLRGRVTSVTPASAAESDLITDIPNAQPADGFAGVSARIGAQSFVVVGSDAGTPLRLRVKNIGPTDEVRPADRTRVALTIPDGHPLHEDFGASPAWRDRVFVVDYDDNEGVDASGARTYEVFLPAPGDPNRGGLPLTTTLEEPLAAGLIGVTAADDKPHTPDSRGDPKRFGNESVVGGPATVFRVRRVKPPAPAVPPDSPKLFASPADYHNHSYFTYRWLPAPHLKTLAYRALDDAVFQADLARRPRTALAASDTAHFPDQATDPSWDAAKRQQVAAELNALNALATGDRATAMAAYRGLSNDGLRVLAGLPGIDRVFVQLTPQALDPDEPDAGGPDGLRWRRVGPDVAPDALAVGERAYVDTLDGRATNRYFYRSAYVDEVQNVGPLGLASPPVWLPDVTAPRAPKLVRTTGGERQITLEWFSNREADLAEYRVYRTDDSTRTRDIRLMTRAHTEIVPPGDPAARPATVSWNDTLLPGLVTFTYRVVAVDGAGNVSDPSPPKSGRAHDQGLPSVPTPTIAWVEQAGVTRAQLGWTSEHDVLVQRRPEGGAWVDLTTWRSPSNVTIRDPFSDPTNGYEYRLWARKYTGATAKGPAIKLEAR
jgi:hypothetical protein